MRKLLISTGTMVGRFNKYNYPVALGEIERLYSVGLCEGFELMMLTYYYDKADEVIWAVKSCTAPRLTIHCEKDVGTLLSDAGAFYADNKADDGKKSYDEAVRLFSLNCEFAERLDIHRMVNSDNNIGYNISALSSLADIAGEYGVRILIENIPSQKYDPRSNWHRLLPHIDGCGLIFDTRFGCLHAQQKEILTDKGLTDRIEHIHISDFGGGYREFKALRPILHPGEGNVDFSETARLLDSFGYDGTITLESPVSLEDGTWDFSKQRQTIAYLRKLFGIQR